MSRRHSHPCDYPGCSERVPCCGRAVVDAIEDGVKSGYLTCEEGGRIEWLCDWHEDECRCDRCGGWDHGDGVCPGRVGVGA